MDYHIFLSYSHLDQHIATELKTMFEARKLRCFVSERSVHPGEDWLNKVRKAIKGAKRVLILVTPRSVSSPWLHIEAGAAWMENRMIVPLTQFVELSELPEVLKNVQVKQIETEAQKRELVDEMAESASEELSIEISLDFIHDQVRLANTQMVQDRWTPDLIIGSGKGGAVCAGMFACYLGVDALKVVGLQFGGPRGNERPQIDNSSLKEHDISGKRILFVEWIRKTGNTFALVKEKVEAFHSELRSYALFWTTQCQQLPEYRGIQVDKAPANPWNLY